MIGARTLDRYEASAQESRYYVLSRSLYRVAVAQARRAALSETERLRILDACEYSVRRLADNPASARVVSRWLCREIRWVYAREDQAGLCEAIRKTLGLAAGVLERARLEEEQPCSAVTRRGIPCQRRARAGSEYCPSHRHLEPGLERRRARTPALT